jgi:sortase A
MLSRIWGLLLLATVCTACAGSNLPTLEPVPLHSTINQVPELTVTSYQFPSATLALPAPSRLQIPALKLDTAIVPVGLEPDGAMAMPRGFDEVGWFSQGAIPGTSGRSTLSGHLDSKSGPAIFYTLHKLKPTDLVYVELGDGQMVATFRITETATYAADQVPLTQIFGPADTAQLVLITCAGNFDRKTGLYSDRLVVYANLMEIQ